MSKRRRAIIIGAGPAGLTAAYEMLKRTDIQPIILERSGDIGGISKTVNYRGNRIDIGGHRFFSKSDRVMEWWLKILPLEQGVEDTAIYYQGKTRTVKPAAAGGPDSAARPDVATGVAGADVSGGTDVVDTADAPDPDKVMLVRPRLSRIYFLRRFFSYPIRLSMDTLSNLGLVRTVRILFSYLGARLFPRKPESSLEDFLINRFGKELYRLFFEDYTEKVWGVKCTEISAEWGAQRIKGVSIGAAIAHAIRELRRSEKTDDDIQQKGTETSLIERFLYPKYGPGQLWEEVARQVQEAGKEIHRYQEVSGIDVAGNGVTAVRVVDKQTGGTVVYEGDYFFSTMAVKDLVAGMGAVVPEKVREVAAGLQYRDFVTVGVLLRKMAKPDLKDTWIYIQEKDVQVGRIQFFNNWSPYLVKAADTMWIGMEYFCNETDAFWRQTDEQIREQAIGELEKMGLASRVDVLDATVLRMEKTYPAYFGTYGQFGVVREFLDSLENLYPVGRNGMHKYNNSDHSMLTAMVAVDNICNGVKGKDNIWSINTEQEYHEEK
jgi:protoporphyrinogen oxidase